MILKKYLSLIPLIGIIIIERFFRLNIDLFLNIISINSNGVYNFDNNFYYQFYRITWYGVVGIIVFLIYNLQFNDIGLKKVFFKPISFAFFSCLPILFGNLIFNFNALKNNVLNDFVSALVSAFGEEIYFRSLIFGLLYFRYKFNFFLSVSFVGVLFGIGHLYQANSLYESLLVFSITFFANGWFSWIYIKTDKNLWYPIAMHFFMNFFWDLFDPSNSVVGGVYINFFRTFSIIICSYFIIKRKNKGLNFESK